MERWEICSTVVPEECSVCFQFPFQLTETRVMSRIVEEIGSLTFCGINDYAHKEVGYFIAMLEEV